VPDDHHIADALGLADVVLIAEIHDLLVRGLTNKKRIASALVNYAFEIVAGDQRAQIFLLQQNSGA
jgi:hypothetical protein